MDGLVAGMERQFIDGSGGRLLVSATGPGWFRRSGADTLFLNLRAPRPATLWGVSAASHALSWVGEERAPRHHGPPCMPHPWPLPSGRLTRLGDTPDDLRTCPIGALVGTEPTSSSAYMFLDTS